MGNSHDMKLQQVKPCHDGKGLYCFGKVGRQRLKHIACDGVVDTIARSAGRITRAPGTTREGAGKHANVLCATPAPSPVRHNLTPDVRPRSAHAKHAPFDCLPVGRVGCALLTMRPARASRAWSAASAASATYCFPSRPMRTSSVSAGGAAPANFFRSRSVDQVGRKSEATLRIASL